MHVADEASETQAAEWTSNCVELVLTKEGAGSSGTGKTTRSHAEPMQRASQRCSLTQLQHHGGCIGTVRVKHSGLA